MTFFRHRAIGPGSAGDVWVTTLHSEGAGLIDAAHAAWEAIWSAFWVGTYGPLVTPQQQITQLVTDQLDPLSGKNVVQQQSAPHYVGTGAGKTVSPRSCLILSFFSALPTRAGRGRMFLPSPDSTHYAATGEFVDGLNQTIADAWKTAMFGQFDAQGMHPVIYHRSTKTGTNITGVKVGTVAGTMRSRTNKVQNNYASSTP